METSIELFHAIEESQGAACHGYCEFEWSAWITIKVKTEDGLLTYGNADGEQPFTTEQLAKFKLIDDELAKDNWRCGHGQYDVRIGYDDVRAGDVEDFRDECNEKLTEKLTQLLQQQYIGCEIDERT